MININSCRSESTGNVVAEINVSATFPSEEEVLKSDLKQLDFVVKSSGDDKGNGKEEKAHSADDDLS